MRTLTAVAAPEQLPSPEKLNPAPGEADRSTGVVEVTAAGFPNASCTSTVTAPEHAPAVTSCPAVVMASAAGGPATTDSIWEVPDSAAAVTDTVTVPARVPLKKKADDDDDPPAMAAEVTGVAQDASEKKVTPVEGDAPSAIEVPAATLVGLPAAFRDSTLIVPEHCPAATVCGGVAKPNAVGMPVCTASTWVAMPSVVDVAEIVTTPGPVP